MIPSLLLILSIVSCLALPITQRAAGAMTLYESGVNRPLGIGLLTRLGTICQLRSYHLYMCCRGQRGRHNQGGYFGNSPQGMPHQRQMQQRNASIGNQNGEIYSSLPVGTKLQGHVETVKEAFGFIRFGTSQSCRAHNPSVTSMLGYNGNPSTLSHLCHDHVGRNLAVLTS